MIRHARFAISLKRRRTLSCFMSQLRISFQVEPGCPIAAAPHGLLYNQRTSNTDLRCTYAHLMQGTRPSKKLTSVKDVKRYLRWAAHIASFMFESSVCTSTQDCYTTLFLCIRHGEARRTSLCWVLSGFSIEEGAPCTLLWSNPLQINLIPLESLLQQMQ